MKRRTLLLVWPLFLAPVLGLASAHATGPVFTDAVNQGAIVMRFFAFVLWSLGSLTAMGVILLCLRKVTSDEVLLGALCALVSIGIFYATALA